MITSEYSWDAIWMPGKMITALVLLGCGDSHDLASFGGGAGHARAQQ
jgi:hypothetical protein